MIALDIDGTLLDGRTSHVPRANIDAIVEAAGRGIEIVLVTGRRFDFTRDVVEQLPCELHLIVSNGALIKSRSGETHLRHLLPRRIAHEVLVATAAYRSGASVVFDRVEENQVMLERIDWEDPTRKIYYQRNRRFLAEASPLESCLDEDPIQVGFTGTVAMVREVIAVLRAHPLANEWLTMRAHRIRRSRLFDHGRAAPGHYQGRGAGGMGAAPPDPTGSGNGHGRQLE